MKLRLPLALLPKHLVALGIDGPIAGYRLSLRWDGRHTLKPAGYAEGQSCIVVVGHELPYRRKLQRMPDSPRARLALLKAAPDEFPFAAGEMHYGLGLLGKEPYLCALPDAGLEALRRRKLHPAIVLVAANPQHPADCLDAVEQYLQQGITADLLHSRNYLSRRRIWQMLLDAGLGLALAGSLTLMALPDLFAGAVERQIEPLRERGSVLPALYRTTEKMAEAQRQASQLFASPEARFSAVLAQLMESIPPGHSLRSIELKNGVLKIYGNGSGMREWLLSQGFPADRITLEDGGSYKRFRAELKL